MIQLEHKHNYKMKTINVNTTTEFEDQLAQAMADGAVVSSVVLTYPTKIVKRFSMKRAFIFGFLAAVLIVVGVLSVQAYDKHRVARNQASIAATAKAKAAEARTWAADQAHAAKVNRLKQQCEKDHTSYLALTPAQRTAKNAVTDCDPSLQVVQ